MKRKAANPITNWVQCKLPAAATVAETTPGSDGEDKSLKQCPFCFQYFLNENIENHVAYHVILADSSQPKGQAKTALSRASSPQNAETTAVSSSSSSLSASSTSSVNAFSKLMHSSQVSSPKKVEFSLYLTEGNKLLPKFTFTGQEDPDGTGTVSLWSSKLRVKNIHCGAPAGKRDLSIELKTNMLPGSSGGTAAAGAMNPPISPAIVKSMLQKAIRRRKGSAAVRLAYELYRLSPQELLRRLPVIIIEDSSLHPAYPILVWCMLAESKGYILVSFDINQNHCIIVACI